MAGFMAICFREKVIWRTVRGGRWSERTQKKKRASWRYGRDRPADANRGGSGREYDAVDGSNKGSQIYGGDAVFRSIRNGGQDTAAWTESRRGNGSLPESKVARVGGGMLPGWKSKKELIAKPRQSQEIEAGLRGTRRREQKAGNWREARDDVSKNCAGRTGWSEDPKERMTTDTDDAEEAPERVDEVGEQKESERICVRRNGESS